jgi:CubicO group peptidase (beta-lactamase class C family)
MSSDFAAPLKVIDAWLEIQRDYENIPSISAGVVFDQELVWSNGFGYSDLSLGTRATDSTIYSICSISKLFTSIAILQLRDQGKLDLDDTISEHLPWFRIGQVHTNSAPITIRSLLTHSSGLPKESKYPYWTDPGFRFPSREQLRRKLSEQNTLYPASTVYEYSNLGVAVVGQVVAEKSGVSYEEYVYDNILNPLGLADTQPELPRSLRRKQLATGYSLESRKGSREELAFFRARSLAPAVGFSSSVRDLARFASWQFHALEVIEDPILSGNTLREMQRVHWMDPDGGNTRGLGFWIRQLDDTMILNHPGGCPGYLSQFVLIPKKEWAFIVMVNGLGINIDQYVEGMYRILRSYEKEESEEMAPDVDFEDYSGGYYSIWFGESLIVPWKGKLAVFFLRYPDQKSPDLLMKHIEGDIFKRIRDDGNLGEEVKFERNEDNRVVRFWQNSQYVEKIDL